MWRESWIFRIALFCSLLLSVRLAGQNTDCVTAQVICSDGPVNFTPSGPGIDDFASAKNRNGCLQTKENQSAWYYFEFRDDMPPNSVIEFTITPFGGYGEDYDFAIFGPNLSCDSLGDPVRCSFAYYICDFCPQTGLGMGATDTSEGVESDGFVAPMVVQPGDGYYLVLDNFAGTSRGFTLQWGGSAAPFLNCQANPFCKNTTVSAGPDVTVCQGAPSFPLEGSATGVSPSVKYTWLGTPETLRFLSDTTIATPILTLPPDFSGTIQYLLSITDGNCILADDVQITVEDNPAPAISGDTSICIGESITLTASTGFKKYHWSNNDTTQVITVNTPGVYTLTVTNINGCTNTNSIKIVRAANPQPAITGGDVVCHNDPLQLDAGANFSTYKWSTGGTSRTININNGGAYSVTVTNAEGCRDSAQITVRDGVKPNVSVLGDSTFCFGSINTLRTNNTFQQYSWSNGASTSTIDVLDSGTYGVTVSDADGCMGEASLKVTRGDSISLAISGKTDICVGDGTQLSATQGFANYAWSNNRSSDVIDINGGGTYSVTVTDVNGCKENASVDVTEHAKPTPVIRGATGICPNTIAQLETDTIYAKYRWSNGANTPSINVSNSGAYTLEVESAEGCVGDTSIILDAFPRVQPKIQGDLTFCPDIGGTLQTTESYPIYKWSNNDSIAITRVFADGTYFVTVTDGNGCVGTDSITVNAYEVEMPPTSGDVPLCQGSSVTLDAGANFPKFEWSNGDTTREISVQTAKSYTVTVTDIQGCHAQATYNVIERPKPTLQIDGSRNLCEGTSTDLVAVGNFTKIKWWNESTSDTVTINAPGTYSVTVTDANFCSDSTSINVIGFPSPKPEIVGPNAICDNSMILLRVKQFYPTYSWSNGASQQSINIDSSGRYSVEVMDDHGCWGSAFTDIAERMAPQIQITGDTFFCKGLMAKIEATPGYYSYTWSNGVRTSSLNVTDPDTYSVLVKDEYGCSNTDSISVQRIEPPSANGGTDKTLDCKITSVQLGDNTTDGVNYEWDGPGINDSNRYLPTPVVSIGGLYTLTTSDKVYGCHSAPYNVRVFDKSYVPEIALYASDTLDCRTPSVVIDASKSMSGNNVVYHWYDPHGQPITNNTTQLSVNQPGKYFFQVEDMVYGCKGLDSIEVRASYNYPVVEAGASQTLTCDRSTVALDGSASSAGNGFNYRWTTADGNILSGATTPNPMIDKTGTYVLAVFNENNGCENSDSVIVLEDKTPPVARATADEQLNCNVSEVTLDGSASNGGNHLEYNWLAINDFEFNNPKLPVVKVNQPGIYLLKVTNLDNGCYAIDTVQVVDDSNYPTGINAELSDPLCLGDKNGKILIKSVTGGTAPYVYSLDGKPFESSDGFSGLGAGNYKLTVEDVAGCRYETEVKLKDGMKLVVDLGPNIFIKGAQEVILEPIVNVPRNQITNLIWEEENKFLDSCICWQEKVMPSKTAFYGVTAINDLGCEATDNVLISIDGIGRIFIPTAFSPDNNGYNDLFMIYAGDEDILIKDFAVYNRWGTMVYHAKQFFPNDPNYGWDGTFKGEKMNAGVYVYSVKVEYYGGATKSYKGDVTLVR